MLSVSFNFNFYLLQKGARGFNPHVRVQRPVEEVRGWRGGEVRGGGGGG